MVKVEHELSAIQAYYPSMRIYRRILYLATTKQNRLCYSCKKVLKEDEPIVKGDTRTTRYYHYDCAQRRRIGDETAEIFIVAKHTTANEAREVTN